MAGLDERTRAGLTVLVAACVPAAAAVAAGMNGDGDGPIFQAGAVIGACAATLMATRRGLWWLVPAQPMVVVPSAVVGMLVAEPSGTKRTKLGTDTVSSLHHAFLITLVALATVLVVALVKAAFGRGGDREPAGAAHGADAADLADAADAGDHGSHRTGAHRG